MPDSRTKHPLFHVLGDEIPVVFFEGKIAGVFDYAIITTMKIVIATPLYPPDIAQPAPYVKELARRLCPKHAVTVVTYGHHPEHSNGVEIITIDKRLSLPIRLVRFARALRKAAKASDIVYVENGPSVEFPAGIIARLTRTPLVVHLGDNVAHRHAGETILYGLLERFAVSGAQAVITDTPPPRPEILPFDPPPHEAMAAYTTWWTNHLEHLEKIFTHV